MTTYVSLLHGINVSGQNKLKMADLKSIYEALGFNDIATYVQSGNVVFDSFLSDVKEIPTMIEEKIKQVSLLNVPVLLRTAGELKQIIGNNPFIKKADIDTTKLYVTFLSETPDESALATVTGINSGEDKFEIINREIYLYCPNGYGRTKYSNDFFERKLHVTATTRNWNTVNALLAIASGRQDSL
ncbi:MAG: DUF1697 domain-containing protein [Dehalococcoidales bacterium]|nr:DUF1697 domain-containing protein [Dehalococcoidales bacterium]